MKRNFVCCNMYSPLYVFNINLWGTPLCGVPDFLGAVPQLGG